MKAFTIKYIGKAVFGENWFNEMSAVLRIPADKLDAYIKCNREIPALDMKKLNKLMEEHNLDIDGIVATMNAEESKILSDDWVIQVMGGGQLRLIEKIDAKNFNFDTFAVTQRVVDYYLAQPKFYQYLPKIVCNNDVYDLA